MTFGRLWTFLAVALPTLAALIATLSAVDLAYQLRAGADILDGGGIPTVDRWTFTAGGLSWLDQQWGAQVLLAAVFRAGGWLGLVVLRAGLVALVFGCLFLIAVRHGWSSRPAAWLTLAAFAVSAPALGLRPQLLGMALFAVLLLLVVDRRNHAARLWLAPVIVLVWANVHGSFILGPLVLGLAWLEDLHDRVERPARTLVIAGVAAIAACVTPFGPTVWTYAAGLSTNPQVTRLISEWQPTSLRDVPGLLFFGSVVAILVLIARRGVATSWPILAWLGTFFIIGAYAARGIAWWSMGAFVAVVALVGVPTAFRTGLGRPESPTTRGMLRLNLALSVVIAAAGVAVLPWWRPTDAGQAAPQGVLTDAPSGITVALSGLARPADRLLNPQRWGSWFEFAVPALTVGIDSRIELFPVDTWHAYDLVEAGGDGWQAQIAQWGVTIVVVEADAPGFADRLSAAGWRSAYSDDDGSVFVAPNRS